MTFDLDTFKRTAGRLRYDDLDFGVFRSRPLERPLLRCVRYMHDVELHTSCYLRNLLNTRAHHDPDITTFLSLWNYEEHWHGEALAAVLRAHDEPAGPVRIAAMRRRLRWRPSLNPLSWMLFSAVNPHFLAVHMTFGVVNEWTTQAGYARLGQLAGHPVLTELTGRIMRQEGRHIDYYLTQAQRRLEASAGAQRTTRAMLRVAWKPVGAGAMPETETRHVIATLFGGPHGRQAAARIDRSIDRLPGLAGLALMERTHRRYV